MAREVLRPRETSRIAVQRARKAFGSRYDNREALNANTFPKLLDNLEEAGVLHQAIGEVRSGRSTIEPTAAFARRTREAGITLADFRRLPHEELIVFRVRHAWLGEAGMESRKDEVDYEETPHTRMLREELRRITHSCRRAFLGGGKRWPKRDKKTAEGQEPKTFAQLMPRGTTYPKFVEAVKSKHPALAGDRAQPLR